MKRIIGVSLVAIWMLVVSTVYADVIHFKSGRKMEGKIIEETKDKITLKTDYAILTFKRSRIASIEYKPYVIKKKKEILPKKATVAPKKELKKKTLKEQQAPLNKLISVNFTDAPMDAVFKFLSKNLQKEVSYDGEIKELGTTTIRTATITFKQLLDTIARQKGLKYEIKEDSIVFTKP